MASEHRQTVDILKELMDSSEESATTVTNKGIALHRALMLVMLDSLVEMASLSQKEVIAILITGMGSFIDGFWRMYLSTLQADHEDVRGIAVHIAEILKLDPDSLMRKPNMK